MYSFLESAFRSVVGSVATRAVTIFSYEPELCELGGKSSVT